jgi:hypothetical protein
MTANINLSKKYIRGIRSDGLTALEIGSYFIPVDEIISTGRHVLQL